jgi:hypothetical protein
VISAQGELSEAGLEELIECGERKDERGKGNCLVAWNQALIIRSWQPLRGRLLGTLAALTTNT